LTEFKCYLLNLYLYESHPSLFPLVQFNQDQRTMRLTLHQASTFFGFSCNISRVHHSGSAICQRLYLQRTLRQSDTDSAVRTHSFRSFYDFALVWWADCNVDSLLKTKPPANTLSYMISDVQAAGGFVIRQLYRLGLYLLTFHQHFCPGTDPLYLYTFPIHRGVHRFPIHAACITAKVPSAH